jgi:hypothetical protein
MRLGHRRIVRWLATVLAVWAVLGIALPGGIMLGRRHRILTAMRSAESVRLEEFQEEGGRVLARHELDAAQRAALIHILSAILPRGFPYSLKFCFVPHHRIVARAADGTEFTLTICFGCDQAQHTGSAIYDMRPAGSAALRVFFEENGVRVRGLDEYATIPDA